jgi:hypothetical protein
VYTCTQPAYRKSWLQGCSSTREASALVFVAASLCFASFTKNVFLLKYGSVKIEDLFYHVMKQLFMRKNLFKQ